MTATRRLLIAGGLVVACVTALGVFVVHLLVVSGAFKTIEPHFNGSCRPVGPLSGPEDVTVHPRSGIAFVSSFDRRSRASRAPRQGAIYALDLSQADSTPQSLTAAFDGPFYPHGLSLYIDEDGGESLFVINHPPGGHVVEVFDFVEDALVHRESIRGAALRSPNDILAVGRSSFYVTNDHRYPAGVMRVLEDFLRLERSDVVYFDGSSMRSVAKNLAYPNGIASSLDQKSIFVASTTGRALTRYERDTTNGALVFAERFPLGTGADNLERGGDGHLWIGAHPNMLAFLGNARDPDHLSPSQVLRFDPSSGRTEEIFLSRGDDLSTSSVGAVYRNRLVIGSVFDEHVLVCEMN